MEGRRAGKRVNSFNLVLWVALMRGKESRQLGLILRAANVQNLAIPFLLIDVLLYSY